MVADALPRIWSPGARTIQPSHVKISPLLNVLTTMLTAMPVLGRVTKIDTVFVATAKLFKYMDLRIQVSPAGTVSTAKLPATETFTAAKTAVRTLTATPRLHE